ncbi:hypothetical protein ACIBHX_15425 [Nonomuraea sp. NPDC050536]|uniref:hypothetical protein n=1 Tax=Nonomuraea sp. NPDC050536 TaxID=3364366 RepID=UPI0037C85B2B
MPGRLAKVVVDPAVPEEMAELLRQNRKILSRMRTGWAPDYKRPAPVIGVALRAVFSVSAVAAVLIGLGLFRDGAYSAFVVAMSAAALLIMGVLLIPRRNTEIERIRAAELDIYDSARKYEGHYVVREDLDEPGRTLLGRAQAAIQGVTDSTVNAEGLLDGVRNAVMLPAQEWEIARLLAKLSALRAEHEEVVAEGITPEVAAVAEPLAEALAISHQAVTARVEALERYAGHVGEAERAYRARNQIERFSAKLPRYEELLAESGADGSAVPELGRLSEDADRLEQALRDSVKSAHEAFRHLRD